MTVNLVCSEALASCATIAFAFEELHKFLSPFATVTRAASGPGDDAIRLNLSLDASLPDGAFAVRPGGRSIELHGSDSAAVLHAVYTLLEDLGYRFEVTGPRAPGSISSADWQRLGKKLVIPRVRWRGIRQHINFPMDLSGYPLDEAQEYIRNLARLRFNAMSFHSYPKQWYEVPGETVQYAGAFFYGRVHTFPVEHPLFKAHVRNKKVFCIPDIEPDFDNPPRRSRRAIEWLQAVMNEAKRVGIRVQMSFEPRSEGTDLSRTLATVDSILADYPMIDALELITEERGGWFPGPEVDALRNLLRDRFGERFLSSPVVEKIIKPNQKDLGFILGQLAHNMDVLKYLSQQWQGRNDRPQLVCGTYCTAPDYLSALVELQRELLPPTVEMAMMPGHSSANTAKQLRTTTFHDEDWKRLTLYSWIEFDGMMYLQQNALHGIREALDYAASYPAGAPKAMLFNHWRTAENQTCTRYAALATLLGETDERRFYRTYAQELGIGDQDAYLSAMQDLNDLDTLSRDLLPNIAFSFTPCWGKPGMGLASFHRWLGERIRFYRRQMEAVRDLLDQCLRATTSDAGTAYLSFLINRLDATVIYSRAMELMATLQVICRRGRKPEDLSPAEVARVREVCDAALLICEEYMEMYCRMMPDRGCEGTLVDFYGTFPAEIKRVRFEYTGVPIDDAPIRHTIGDAPHVPV